MKKWKLTALAALSISLVASLFTIIPATATSSQPTPDEVIQWPGSEANQASYWEGWLEDNLGGDWECHKVDREGDFTTQHHWDAIITKGGQWNNIFYDVPAETHFTEVIRPNQPPAGISHWFKCNGEGPPPPPDEPEPTLEVRLACVEGASGVKNTLRVAVTYDTDGPELTLARRIWVDGLLRLDSEIPVQGGPKTIVTRRLVGQGDHLVRVVAKLGDLRVVRRKIIHCDVVAPRAKISGPFGDPEYFGTFVNRRSTVAISFIWRFVRNGDVIKIEREVPAGAVFRTKCKVIDPGTKTWINYVRPSGQRVRLATIDETAPLDFYPACPV